MSSTTLQYVTSKDGTTIAYDRLGDGPPVVLVAHRNLDRTRRARVCERRVRSGLHRRTGAPGEQHHRGAEDG